MNGWQHIQRPDGNTTPAFGTQIKLTPSEKISLNSSTFIGNDKPDSIRQWRYFHNFYGIFQLSKQFGITAGFDCGIQQKSKGSSEMNSWYSPVIILKLNAGNKNAFAARAEYYNDENGVIISTGTPNGFKTFGLRLNYDHQITSNAVWRIEVRNLSSKDEIFIKKDNSLSNNETFITTSLAVSF